MTKARRYLLRVSLMIVVDITFAYVTVCLYLCIWHVCYYSTLTTAVTNSSITVFKVCGKSNFIDKYSNSTILIVQLSDGGQRGATNLSGATHLPPPLEPPLKIIWLIIDIITPLLKKTPALTSLLFHAGQAAIKLPSAEASNWAQCCAQDNIQLTWRE